MSYYYSTLDINNILFTGFAYKLPEPIVNTISELDKIFGLIVDTTSTIKPKSYEKKSIRPVPDNDWTAVRTSFKTTKLDVKEGIEKDVNNIRSSLNKISIKNYSEQSTTIIEFISTFLDSQTELDPDEQLANTRKIAQSIFDIASTNKTNSLQYAELYYTLIQRFPVFSGILNEYIENFKNTIQHINYIDPAENYDKFCVYTKTNDIRKSSTLFLVNLMKLTVISKNTIIDIVLYFQDTVLHYITESGRTNEVEEIVENVFLFITHGLKHNDGELQWTKMIDNIQILSSSKPKEYPSMTSRAIFKCLDIMDSLDV